MPTANPMNHCPDTGHCIASITLSATAITPDATIQPQVGNRSTADPIALNSPATIK